MIIDKNDSGSSRGRSELQGSGKSSQIKDVTMVFYLSHLLSSSVVFILRQHLFVGVKEKRRRAKTAFFKKLFSEKQFFEKHISNKCA